MREGTEEGKKKNTWMLKERSPRKRRKKENELE